MSEKWSCTHETQKGFLHKKINLKIHLKYKVQKCDFCGSQFGERKCYFCEKHCCTSCMTDDKSRCKRCYINKRKLGWKIFKRNKVLLGFIAFVWAYAVFPIPLIPGLDPTFYWITFAAALLFMIPVGFMIFFWSRNPPSSDV